eukprot:767761-Hanusia_phi.AAC.4
MSNRRRRGAMTWRSMGRGSATAEGQAGMENKCRLTLLEAGKESQLGKGNIIERNLNNKKTGREEGKKEKSIA